MKTKTKNIYRKISALTWKEGELYVAKAIEIEIASQGKTRKEALSNLKEALELYFEEFTVPPKNSNPKNFTLSQIDIKYA